MNTTEQHPNVSPPGPNAIVIFGATGDLTKRLLIPAVYNLAAAGLLPEKFAVVGVAIETLTGQQFAEKLLDVWSNLPARKFPNYAAGTWGPQEADDTAGQGRPAMAESGRMNWASVHRGKHGGTAVFSRSTET